MKVKVLVFASYAEALGTREMDLELPSGASAGDCLAAIRGRTGEGVPATALLAVNRRYAAADRPLADGDEVALIPPVAGG